MSKAKVAVRMRFGVSDDDTAVALGSGDMEVLGTPRLIAWMEAATVEAAASLLDPGQTTVGTAVRIRHRRPTRVGETVEVKAEPNAEPDGNRITFDVRATDDFGEVIADGDIDRAIVDREQFLSATS